jgi:glycosyltransferase involved in cell wall biosynthesis
MKVLVSAYACDPHRGSEPGLGWKWSLEIAKRGHQVWVLTRIKNVALIDAAIAKEGNLSLRAVGYDLPSWMCWWKSGGLTVQIYYALWQVGAFFKARRLHQNIEFDLVHHLTFGVFRTPGFMWGLGIPFLLGPVGGGEFTPTPLTRHFSLRARLFEAVRKLANYLSLLDPGLLMALIKARWVYVCTRETAAFLPRRFASKVQIEPIIAADASIPLRVGPLPEAGGLKMLFVGRLLHWKGVELALRSLALARLSEPGITLTLLGKGPQETELHQLAVELKIEDALSWKTWVEADELDALYYESQAFIFPSLHESGGMVVVEAMQRGLPVLCLGIGGPAIQVNATRGVCIDIKERSEKQVLADMAEVLCRWARRPEQLPVMGARAHEYCKTQEWDKKVGRVYGQVERDLDATA